MSGKVGLDCKLYYLSTGDRASWDGSTDTIVSGSAPANLTEIDITRDVTLGLEKTEVDGSARDSTFEQVLTALKKAPVEIQIRWESGSAFNAFRDAFFNDTQIALAVLDGASDTVGSCGLWADFEVLSFKRTETLEGLVVADITCKPGVSDVKPQWVTVST